MRASVADFVLTLCYLQLCLCNFGRIYFRSANHFELKWRLQKISQNIATKRRLDLIFKLFRTFVTTSRFGLIRISKVRNVPWQNCCHLILQRVSLLTKRCRVYTKGSQIPDPIFSTVHSAEKNVTSYKRAGFFTKMKQKNFKMADLENSKWPPKKNLVFQLRQFSIFFHEIFTVWSLG